MEIKQEELDRLSIADIQALRININKSLIAISNHENFRTVNLLIDALDREIEKRINKIFIF